jgi:hypothetical protein
MKNSSDTISNLTCDLLACSEVPQTTAPQHTPTLHNDTTFYSVILLLFALAKYDCTRVAVILLKDIFFTVTDWMILWCTVHFAF